MDNDLVWEIKDSLIDEIVYVLEQRVGSEVTWDEEITNKIAELAELASEKYVTYKEVNDEDEDTDYYGDMDNFQEEG